MESERNTRRLEVLGNNKAVCQSRENRCKNPWEEGPRTQGLVRTARI